MTRQEHLLRAAGFGKWEIGIWKLTRPHRWFAWYPCELDDGRMRWLRIVERRLVLSPALDSAVFHYRAP